MLLNSECKVRTVTGDVDAVTLGHTQCHEHIFLRKGPSFVRNPALCMDDYDRSLRELLDYHTAGGQAIVDAQPGGFGRDAEMLLHLSRASGVQIISVTGFHKLEFMEPDCPLGELTVGQQADRFYAELTQGMQNPSGSVSSAKAGAVKAVFPAGAWTHPVYVRLLEAAAQAAARAGAPVMIHTEPDANVLELLPLFASHGVPANRLLICHLDRTRQDAAYHRQVLDAGCILCYDSINRLNYLSHQQELTLIRDMCSGGYEEQIVLSLDTTNRRLRAYNGQDMGLDYLLTQFIPVLGQTGITNAQIQKMCVSNAASILRRNQTEEKRR